MRFVLRVMPQIIGQPCDLRPHHPANTGKHHARDDHNQKDRQSAAQPYPLEQGHHWL